MPLARNEVLQALRRLLSNGRLDNFPKRDEDRQMLLALGAWRVREAAVGGEKELNELLDSWLSGFCFPTLDHVSFRRALVDFEFMGRSMDGARYWLNNPRIHRVLTPDALDVEPAEVMAVAEREREVRKRSYLAAGDPGDS